MQKKISKILDGWALGRVVSSLNQFDPLMARRLRLMMEEGYTLDELIALEDEGFRRLAERLLEGAAQDNDEPRKI
ncbi:hypothetical protein [Streptomyces bacillaris]|uniref:hypothetical protein n=1 Tax=Streptomyces bacillaris TaxID=68179 RepID=UPI00381F31A0